MPKKPTIINPIDASFEDLTKSVVLENLVPPNETKENKALEKKLAVKVPPQQSIKGLPLFESITEKEIDGVGMGVLNNGMPYLTGGGLAKLCGVDTKAIRSISNNWIEEKLKPRGKFIADILEENRYTDDSLYIRVHTKGDQHINAYPDVVCMAFLEYYAFEASKKDAISNYRTLARKTLRDFIYDNVGYDPDKSKIDSWKYYHDRVSILQNKVPDGYFSIFNEIAGMTVDLIIHGFSVNEKNIPDISVGIAWANHWRDNNLSKENGERIEYEHNYPSYYSQSSSNPQKPAAYPISALGQFRIWFKQTYLISKFPKYILNKAKVLQGGKEEAEKLIDVFKPKQLN